MKEQQMNVGEICNHSVVFAYKHMTISEAARLMGEQHVGSLVIVDETDKGRVVIGMLTDRDIAIHVVARDVDATATRIADIMSNDLVTARADDTPNEVLSRMHLHGVRRVPITTAGGILVGIVALDDLLEEVDEDLLGLVHTIGNEQRRDQYLNG